MNEQQLSEKLSNILDKSEKYKTMVKTRARLERVGDILERTPGALTVGTLGSLVVCGSAAAGGVALVVTVPLFFVGNILGWGCTLWAGQTLKRVGQSFNPNDSLREMHMSKTLAIIQDLDTKELPFSIQSNVRKTVDLLSDKNIPPVFWSEVNNILQEINIWYKNNCARREQTQNFNTHLSEFQQQFDLHKDIIPFVKVESVKTQAVNVHDQTPQETPEMLSFKPVQKIMKL